MATIAEINNEKDAAVAILDDRIVEAIRLKNARTPGMDQALHDLMSQRVTVFLQAYVASLESADLQNALAVMQGATADMHQVAAQMIGATNFINKAAEFLGAAQKVAGALKGTGSQPTGGGST